MAIDRPDPCRMAPRQLLASSGLTWFFAAGVGRWHPSRPKTWVCQATYAREFSAKTLVSVFRPHGIAVTKKVAVTLRRDEARPRANPSDGIALGTVLPPQVASAQPTKVCWPDHRQVLTASGQAGRCWRWMCTHQIFRPPSRWSSEVRNWPQSIRLAGSSAAA